MMKTIQMLALSALFASQLYASDDGREIIGDAEEEYNAQQFLQVLKIQQGANQKKLKKNLIPTAGRLALHGVA